MRAPSLTSPAPATLTGPGCSVAVDARGLDESGIGRYLREVLRGLLADQRLSRLLLAGEPERLRGFIGALPEASKARIIPFPYGFYSPAAHVEWGVLELRGRLKADVAFFPHYDVPLSARRSQRVVVVHDLIHFRLPHLFPLSKRMVASVVLRRAVQGSSRVIVLSEATRQDLVERHPGVADRVAVIPNGVSSEIAAGSVAPRIRGQEVGQWQPYLLCVGNRKPHKNLVAAVEALAALRPERPELRLLIVGRSFGDDAVGRRATALGVSGALVEIDEVTDAELRALYRGAEALLFTSLYEGFGLPVLEAMAFGLPVVASDRAAVPEVVGDAGLLVNPEEPAMVAAAVRRLRDEPELRKELVERGKRRAAALSWDRSAERTADLLVEVAIQRAGSDC